MLYEELKKEFELPSRVATDCYREALSIYKSWLNNENRGKLPAPKTLRMLLTHNQGFRVRDGYVEIIGGYRLKIIGWDRRYDGYENGEARLVYRDGKLYLFITKKTPKPGQYKSYGILAVDVNERTIVFGNSLFTKSIDTHLRQGSPLQEAC